MNRDELEHLIRASGAITNQYEFVIVGSQSILGPIPYPEPEFKMSAEAEILKMLSNRYLLALIGKSLEADLTDIHWTSCEGCFQAAQAVLRGNTALHQRQFPRAKPSL